MPHFVALGEAGTGLAFLTVPSLVGQLLFGQELTGVAIPLARVIGILLIALGVACWPGPALVGMLTYSAVVALYLAYLGFVGGSTGFFLWPAVVLHVILTSLLSSDIARMLRDLRHEPVRVEKPDAGRWPRFTLDCC
jgi:hypothetical protein